jgi:hypothetical protein
MWQVSSAGYHHPFAPSRNHRQFRSSANSILCIFRHRGGLYSLYSIAHAQFVWDAKTEPEYINLFARIWGTEKLLGAPLQSHFHPSSSDKGRN